MRGPSFLVVNLDFSRAVPLLACMRDFGRRPAWHANGNCQTGAPTYTSDDTSVVQSRSSMASSTATAESGMLRQCQDNAKTMPRRVHPRRGRQSRHLNPICNSWCDVGTMRRNKRDGFCSSCPSLFICPYFSSARLLLHRATYSKSASPRLPTEKVAPMGELVRLRQRRQPAPRTS